MCGYTGHEFGASYPDSVCIDGYLWDADSGDEDGLSHGGEWACPRCNTRVMLENARDEAIDGGAGVYQFAPYCAAILWEGAVRKAMAENRAEAEATLALMEPFDTDDWPDRQAVYEHRAAWHETVTVRVDPRAALKGGEHGEAG